MSVLLKMIPRTLVGLLVPVLLYIVKTDASCLNIPQLSNLSYCRCSSEAINCTNPSADDQILELPLQVPVSIQSIIISGFNLSTIPKNVFGTDHHDGLTVLDLSRNKITRINAQAFHYMPNVTTLILDDNEWDFESDSVYPRVFNHSNLVVLSLRHAFKVPALQNFLNQSLALKTIFEESSMNALETLRLDSNSLIGLDRNFFMSMPALKSLHLSNNQFFMFSINWLNLTKLVNLDLARNQLDTLSEDFLSNITWLNRSHSLRTVHLAGNPFNCDCRLREFHSWLLSNASIVIADKNELECVAASKDDLVAKLLIDVALTDLVCNVDPSQVVETSYVMLAVVLGIVLLLAVVILFLNRKFFALKFANCKQSLSKASSYRRYAPVR